MNLAAVAQAARDSNPESEEAIIKLAPANAHRLAFKLEGRLARHFTREEVAELAAAIGRVSGGDAVALIGTLLPGFKMAEYVAICRAVQAFEHFARIEANRENPRHWTNFERVAL